jgi:hypothetical protein
MTISVVLLTPRHYPLSPLPLSPPTAGAALQELIPLRQYYHRHSRPIFWQMRELVPFGNHPVFRWLLGWVLPFKISLLKLTTPKSIGKVCHRQGCRTVPLLCVCAS